jgi:hypothetical protein
VGAGATLARRSGLFWPAYGPHSAVTALRRRGTLSEGGEYESEYVAFYGVSGGRITRLEMLEPDALDAALARFEELRPEPLGIPRTVG